MASSIDEEVHIMIDKAYERTKDLLREHSEELEVVAQELLKKEVLFKEDLVRLIGERPFGVSFPDEELQKKKEGDPKVTAEEVSSEETATPSPSSEEGEGNAASKDDSAN